MVGGGQRADTLFGSGELETAAYIVRARGYHAKFGLWTAPHARHQTRSYQLARARARVMLAAGPRDAESGGGRRAGKTLRMV